MMKEHSHRSPINTPSTYKNAVVSTGHLLLLGMISPWQWNVTTIAIDDMTWLQYIQPILLTIHHFTSFHTRVIHSTGWMLCHMSSKLFLEELLLSVEACTNDVCHIKVKWIVIELMMKLLRFASQDAAIVIRY